jgi:hypothetical protein
MRPSLVNQDKFGITVPMYIIDLLNLYSLLDSHMYFYFITPVFIVLNKNKLNISLRHYTDNKNKLVYSYLAGLIEGDGHLNVPKGLKTSSLAPLPSEGISSKYQRGGEGMKNYFSKN